MPLKWRMASKVLMSVDPGSILWRATFFVSCFFFFSLQLDISPHMGLIPGNAHFFRITLLFFLPFFSPLCYNSFLFLFFLFFFSFFCPSLISSSPFALPSFLSPLLFFLLILFLPLFFLLLSAAFLSLFPPFLLFSWFLPHFAHLSVTCFFFLLTLQLFFFSSRPTIIFFFLKCISPLCQGSC